MLNKIKKYYLEKKETLKEFKQTLFLIVLYGLNASVLLPLFIILLISILNFMVNVLSGVF